MKNADIPLEKKLTVYFRVEAGCLGPNGSEIVVEFCKFAQTNMPPFETAYIDWMISPRLDKSFPEMEYKINNKKLTEKQTFSYLSVFGQKKDEFEEHFQESLADLIEQYLGR